MKRILFVLAVICITSVVKAQTWNEWFRQKRTQIRYLTEQITALRTYGSAVRKGYMIVDNGLTKIGNIKENDLLLHQDHFASLLLVKPTVKGSTVLQRISLLEGAISGFYEQCRKMLAKESVFSISEKDYFNTVLFNVLNQYREAGEETRLLIADGFYSMHDDERLKRLQGVSNNLEELYEFVRHFQQEVAITAINRLREIKNVKTLKSFYDK